MPSEESSAGDFHLHSPFLNLSFEFVPRYPKTIIAVWMAFWAVVGVALLYAYAVLLPAWVGFETALLVGVEMIVLSVSGISGGAST